MADSFIDPATQAEMKAAMAALKGQIGETQALVARAEAQMTRAESAARRGGSLEPSAPRRPPAAAPETAGVEREMQARKALNKEIKATTDLRAEGSRVILPTGGGGRPFEQTLRGQMQAEQRARTEAAAAEARRGVPGYLSSPTTMQRQTEALRRDSLRDSLVVPQARGQVVHGDLAGGQVAREAQAREAEAAALQKVARAQTTVLASGSQLGKADQEYAAKAQAQAGTAVQRAASERKIGSAMQESVLYAKQADDAMTRHGALTSEFISAASRGQVTMRELGNQMVMTIGKFAGWTIAATAVYGAVGAFDKLAKGAIAAQSATQGLTRFIPNLNKNLAGAQIGNIAHDINVPIEQVGEAAGAFARIFKNQGDVMTATRVALLATKLDNIELADSYRYLTSLVQEFGLSASQLPGVFDQIEAAQAKGGARVSELFPALSKSLAAAKSAQGGTDDQQTFNQLLALEAATIVRTGQRGNTVGTGFSRGAANFFTSPSSQALFARLGIAATPDVGYTQALINAIHKVSTSKGKISGPEVQAISKAFFGPLRGGLFPGLFRSEDLVKQFGAVTSPKASAGQAQRELKAVLSQANEQISALGVNLETLGASLARSGLVAPFAGLVKLLNTSIHLTSTLASGFASLPIPEFARQGIGGAAALFGVRAITRRAGVPSGVPFFGRTPAQMERATVSKGLVDESAWYQQQWRTTAQSAATANLTTQRALLARNEAAAGSDLERQSVTQQAYKRALEESQALQNRRLALEEQALFIEQRNTLIQAEINKGMAARAAAAKYGAEFTYGTLASGVVTKGAVVPLVRQGVQEHAIPMDPQYTKALGPLTQEAATAAAVVQQSKFAEQMGRSGSKLRDLAGTTARGTSRIDVATAGIASASTATKGFIGKIGGWGGALLGFALIAGQIQTANQEFDQATQAVNKALGAGAASFDEAAANAVTTRQAIADLRKKYQGGLFGSLPVVGDFARWVSDLPGIKQFEQRMGTYNESDQASAIQDAQDSYDKAGNALLKQLESGWSELDKTTAGRQAMYRRMQLMRENLKDILPDTKAGRLAYHTISVELQQFYDRFQAAGNVLPVDPKDVFKQFRSQGLDTTATQAQTLAQKGQIYGVTPEMVRQLTAASQWVTQAYAGRSNDAAALQKINEVRQAANGAIQQYVTQFLDASKTARTAKEANADIDKASQAVADWKADTKRGEAQLQTDVQNAATAWTNAVLASGGTSKQAQDALKKLKALQDQQRYGKAGDKLMGQQLDQALRGERIDLALSTIQTQGELATSKIGGVNTNADIARKKSDLATLKREKEKAVALKADWKTISGLEKQINDAARELLSAQNQAAESLLQAQNALATSQITGTGGTADLARAQSTLQGLRALAALHRAQHADRSVQLQDQANINDQQNTVTQQAADNAKSMMAANDAIAKARITGTSPAADLARARADVTAALHTLQFDKAHHADQAQIAQDYAAMLGAQNSLNDLIRQQALQADQDAAALIEARAQLAEARTLDPIRAAKIQLGADIAVLKTIKPRDYSTYAEYQAAVAQQQAKVLTDRRGVKDLTVQNKENDIEFYLEMGKISTSAAIAQYQALLKMHNLTKETRRQILQRIHALETGDGTGGKFDLAPGSIKLPTPYDVSRAMKGAWAKGTQRRGESQTWNTANEINVYVNSPGDVPLVTDAIERSTGSHLSSRMRAAGVRGT